jgi:hypothetical protein
MARKSLQSFIDKFLLRSPGLTPIPASQNARSGCRHKNLSLLNNSGFLLGSLIPGERREILLLR